MDMWDYDVRSSPDAPAAFSNLTSLCRYFERFLAREQIEERVDAEKLVFVVRRESSLEDTMRQFLRRVEQVLRAEADGLPQPEAGILGMPQPINPQM